LVGGRIIARVDSREIGPIGFLSRGSWFMDGLTNQKRALTFQHQGNSNQGGAKGREQHSKWAVASYGKR
jgi:hypothetical protein